MFSLRTRMTKANPGPGWILTCHNADEGNVFQTKRRRPVATPIRMW
ncbi:hypothetical protein THTE_1116 [Thermogutta terrifontis]|uniref:Uncharacterized protein n=1 Tax=Thermogutta terrifontis TaxID=1331910 RepID=A0A286RCN6_9BACT|nr:hypothetical protein THTE_1116 [Thermogutta terrifontis]